MYSIRKNHDNFVFIVKEDSVISIPKSESNADYLEYLKWLDEGNTPEEWEPAEVKANEE